ncbi:hypothetical protein V1511DRAFT_507411 [Dipodascopsis uninucleata]
MRSSKTVFSRPSNLRLPRSSRTSYPSSGTGSRFNRQTHDKTSIRTEGSNFDGSTSIRDSDTELKLEEETDTMMGFPKYEAGPSKVGWLINMHSTIIQEQSANEPTAAVNFYFLGDDGENFKAVVKYDPYFLIGCKTGLESETEEYLIRKYEGILKKTSRVTKEDLNMPNHLVGYRRTFIKLSFENIRNLLAVRRDLMPLAERNRERLDALDVYAEVSAMDMELDSDILNISPRPKVSRDLDVTDYITDVREYDVPYHVRVSIDKDIRIGKWYTVEAIQGDVKLIELTDRLTRPDPVVLAFDIETTKLPLKFPDVAIDQIMMISYMIDGSGYLITNREIISEDIEDFEYTPKDEYRGVFTIFNEPNEKSVIERFFEHIKEVKPTVIATYNGDFFDWPFVDGRAKIHGIDMYKEIGFQKDSEDEYKSSYCCHMDCFRWVKRDSYLPQGSQGLKSVTRAKMGYDPIEIDPELMTKYASEQPQTLSEYSVSDAVATYYLYMKYIHPFIFSLCNIIPLNPDEVLRKGTGTLCEMLLMVQAYNTDIILPNKHKEADERFFDGHLIESETYVGGHVESIEAGVFRSDIPVDFAVDPSAVDQLLADLDNALRFNIEVESKKNFEDVLDYESIKNEIIAKLIDLKTHTQRTECPIIYHLDVSSMYPNIMITNRLQPDSMISEGDCATCDFNKPGKTCDRRLPWMWRGEFYPAKKDDYNMVRRTLNSEQHPGKYPGQPSRSFNELSMSEQNALIKKRLSDYSRKIYHKIKETKIIEREAIICQRENPFYADTVRDFRDRRYEYKNKQKLWKRNLEKLSNGSSTEKEEAKKMVILFDSLQLAHKCILNSFYGYVMRKGSRWYSMEMAGVTCLTGARIIQMARTLVEKLGRPLELDTDGIWCIFPKSFPENFSFTLQDGKKLFISYPCVMLNYMVHQQFTNDQYHSLVDPVNLKYEVQSENSIFFEVDGPYRAMIIPTSKEENKNLKKRYAVFNDDGSLAELKGFEVKRRGELKLIKIFQSKIFEVFLHGKTLKECYGHVAKVSNRWLDIIDSKGATLADDELIDLICENRSMSRTLEDYGLQKSTSITTARRLAEFLGDQMVKDKGLACKYIISEKPKSAPITERAVPVAIFSAEQNVKSYFLKRWLKDGSLMSFDPRDIIDWEYYRERLSSVIQKIITIPAALQKVENPVPRVKHPDWLYKRLARQSKGKQQILLDIFTTKTVLPMADVTNRSQIIDLEDLTSSELSFQMKPNVPVAMVTTKRKSMAKDSRPCEHSENIYASLPSYKPSINEDYVGWLQYMKQKWKIQRHARERRKHLFGTNNTVRGNGNSVYGFVRNQAAAFSKLWHIVQIRDTDIPGELRCWIMIEGRIRSTKINVRKQVYINFKNTQFPDMPINDFAVEKVNHILPNGNTSDKLFRVSMSEEFFRRQQRLTTNMFTHHSVEGVYESQIDAVTRAVLNIGNSCKLDTTKAGALGKGLEFGFDLSSLVRSDSHDDYLLTESLKVIFLYHTVAGDRQVFALFSTFSNQCDVLIYENSNREKQAFPNLEKVYREQYDQNIEKGRISENLFSIQKELQFDVVQSSNIRKVKKLVSSKLMKLYTEGNGQALFAAVSREAGLLEKEFVCIREMPSIWLAVSSSDLSMHALSWQYPTARRLCSQYQLLGTRIEKLLNLSRYSGIPLGNLREEDEKYLIDVQYARKLQNTNVILWWSPSPYADYGGSEKDRSVLSMEDFSIPHINNPGSYEQSCVDITLKNLVVSTVLTSSLIDEMERPDDMQASNISSSDGTISFMANASSAPAISVLRDLLRQWWEEALKENLNADIMVNNFVYWVSSPSSYLYDPVLEYHVRNLSRKAFLQLVAEFRRVGSSTVMADQNRLVIRTTKMDLHNASSYSQYILKSLRTKPLFQFLDFEIKRYWHYLLWMDDANYGGFSCKPTESIEDCTIEMHWHIKNFLPMLMREEFEMWISQFICRMRELKLETLQQSQTRRSLEDIDNDKYFGKGIIQEMRSGLIDRTRNLLKRQTVALANGRDLQQYSFPELAGSHLSLSNGVLELIKSLCAAFGLAKGLNVEVRMLRRDLLHLFDIKEFSEQGIFKNPSTSLKICRICKSCKIESTMDFCREEITGDVMGEQRNMHNHKWYCKYCGSEFEKLSLEEQMIGNVQYLITTYQSQDMKCSKCRQIRGSNLSEHCSCSGSWMMTKSSVEILKQIDVYKRVASYFNFVMLSNLLEFL